MSKIETAVLGCSVGLLHTLILWASLQTLAFPSWLLYKDKTTLPLQVTLVVDVVIIATIVSSVWWLPALMKLCKFEE